MYKHNPASRLLLLLVLLLLIQLPVVVPLVHRCLVRDELLGCAAGQVILVESAFLGVSEGHDPATGNCPKTSDKCHQYTPRVAKLCSRRHTCSLAYPGDTVIYLQNGCGLTNYFEVTFTCIQVSATINICGWSGVVGEVTSYIVNDDYPDVIPTQPHICHCTIQRAPASTAPTTGVALIVRDAYFTGSSCQQKLYVELLGHSTQNSTVCSGSQRVIGRKIFSRSSKQNGETISLTFDKLANFGDGGTFVIEAQATSLVAIKCSTSARPPSSPTKIVPTHWTSSVLITNNPTVPPESTAGIPQGSSEQHLKTTPLTTAPFASHDKANSNELEREQAYGDRFATGIGAGIGVGLAMALCSGIVIFVVMYRRRCLHCDGSSMTCIQSSDAPSPGATSRAPVLGDPGDGVVTDDNPVDTSSSRHYEPLQGVTTPSPVTYENVQASNYESLDVAPNDPDGSTLPMTTYEVFHPNTHPT